MIWNLEATPGIFSAKILWSHQPHQPPQQLRACRVTCTSSALFRMRILCGVYHTVPHNGIKIKFSKWCFSLQLVELVVVQKSIYSFKKCFSNVLVIYFAVYWDKTGHIYQVCRAKQRGVGGHCNCWVTGSVLMSYTILHNDHTTAFNDLFTEPRSPSVSTVLLLHLHLLCHILYAF